jgi:hypothetical protein
VEITSAMAVWYHTGMPPLPVRWVLVRDPHGEFDPQALRCMDVTVDPVQILEWFVLRWRLAGTGPEARAHVGRETQRQWNAMAIARTTPALLGLFALVTRMAGQVAPEHVWSSSHFYMSPAKADLVEIPRALLNRLTDTLCYAA